MSTRRPIMKIVKEVTRKLRLKGYSIRKIEEELLNLGFNNINRGKLIRTFYTSNKNQQEYLNSVDDTIEAVLTWLDLTEEDLFISLLDQSSESRIPKDISDFIRDPDGMIYLREAYKKYKADKLEKEIEAIREQIRRLEG